MASRTRFVWVREAHSPRIFQGYVLDWRHQAPDVWEALVTYATGRGSQILTEWVPRDRLIPVEAEQPNGGTAYG